MPKMGPPARRCLIPSLQWAVASLQGGEAPGLGYLVEY
jgi:hypothetical protein